MTLTEMIQSPLNEVLKNCNVVDVKFHSDDSGEVKSVEVKYEPRDITKDTTARIKF